MDLSDTEDELLGSFASQLENSMLNAVPHNGLLQTNNTGQDPPSETHLKVLSEYFGHKKFRIIQWRIISSILRFQRDNCAIMATGYGKSLCYQFPAVYNGGVTLVVSPLISLMEDQVMSLKVSNISACLLGSAQTNQMEVINGIFDNKYRVVYLTPEFCTNGYGKQLLCDFHKKLNIILIAVDEAHCVSTWGHDFRFAYRKLGLLREIMPEVPILAVTATATPQVKTDIISVLKLRNPQISCSGFDRPNLYFAVNYQSGNAFADLTKLMVRKRGLWRFHGPTIIYCITRKDTETISELLQSHDIKCLPYHAGMTLSERSRVHEEFIKDKTQVIVATVAFGMGIDKHDVRCIIHYGSSNSVESYYQEVGRAGRDGLPAKCVTFYNNKDFNILALLRSKSGDAITKSRKEKMANIMRQYLETSKCRRQFILSHFENDPSLELPDRDNCCDNCDRKQKSSCESALYEGLNKQGLYDFTDDAVLFLTAVNSTGGRFGLNLCVLFIRGSKTAKLECFRLKEGFGKGADKPDSWWKGIAAILIQRNFLFGRTQSSLFGACTYQVTSVGNTFLESVSRGEKLMAPPSKELIPLLKKSRQAESGWVSAEGGEEASSSTQVLDNPPEESKMETDERLKCYRLLINERNRLASINDVMPYTVASNAALMQIAKHKPKDLEQLRKLQVEGFTEAKLLKFGPDLLKITQVNASNDRRSILSILAEHPLENISESSAITFTMSLFNSGLTIEEIAEKRKISPSTVMLNLVAAMEIGWPIKMSQLGVTNDVRDIIVETINNLDSGFSSLLQIKSACPENVKYDQIRVVVTYLKIRDHLEKLKIPYEEFDDFRYFTATPSPDNSMKPDDLNLDDDILLAACYDMENKLDGSTIDLTGTPENSNDVLLAACYNIENELQNHTPKSSSEPPEKKYKCTDTNELLNILNSPPRDCPFQVSDSLSKESQEREPESNSSNGSQPRALSRTMTKVHSKPQIPQWLMKKKR
ncbi:bifunctional 3'-5' exonuclease/ATP-dependent helicase WRN-like [Cylas formicarius]|uniref:bifunctional 3'-5' exonuclease/ATP-dependent helicase WRN-like n=1 Tax=Cylas formicarius TaxID=197179 RepID=UPI002958628A|nr:bifunctional 3'-5' exonuclease/ATP-dependent helicase WRN-like [Cylas formicarius]